MIRFAMEIPAALVENWVRHTELDFVLAHKVLEDSAYASFFAGRPHGRELILDNSMHELGHPLPVSDLRAAASACRANYVVAPDRLGEPEWNIVQFRETRKAFEGSRIGIGVVLSGRSYEERKRYTIEVCGADMLLLPYRENRLLWYLELQDLINSLFSRVHLLGVSTREDLQLFAAISKGGLRTSTKWSVDTAKPFKHGFANAHMADFDNWRGGALTSKDLLNVTSLTLQQELVIKANIDYVRGLCR